MAKSDFYPATDGAKLAFLENLMTQIPTVSATVGLTATDVTAITWPARARAADRV